MAVSLSTGFVRIGVLLSVVWVLGVFAMVIIESNKRNNLCAATPTVRMCKHMFWAWETPEGDKTLPGEKTAETPAAEEKPEAPRPLGHVLARKIAEGIVRQIEKVESREFKIQPQRVAMGIFGPLALFWALGYGIAWCVMGFKQQKK